jgi:Uma2 family endonuclease
LIQAIQSLLTSRLDGADWIALPGGFAVETGRGIRFPDVILQRRALLAATDQSTATPTLLFEVLSPSTITLDLVVRPREYLTIASLGAYVVVSQFEPRVTVWQRPAAEGRDERPFPSLPVEMEKATDEIAIPSLGIVLTLGDIYRGIREFA